MRDGEADELALAVTALCRAAIVTDSAAGALVADLRGIHYVPATQVTVADTTGAGDAFAGTLAALWRTAPQCSTRSGGRPPPCHARHPEGHSDALSTMR